ncbi:PIN domain-containing protein [Bacillus thuringiensis]|uniref:PIN domain-containing protein n=1 Tax=Bacillus thuringiensis TaxID=1428 RepID=UPI0035DA92B6
MKLYDKYFIYPSKLESLYKEGAIIIPDTNFLLSAYQWRNVTTDKVKKVLQELNTQDKLRIPEQVLYEFVQNRQKVLFEQISFIDHEISRFNEPKKAIKEFMPIAESSPEIDEAQDKRNSLSQAIGDYKNSLKQVKKKIEALIQHDDFLNFIKELCQDSFLPYSEDKEKIREEGQRRIVLGIKPGTNENKGDPTGDFIIWSEVMKLKEHIIFVSNDQKKDWVFKGKGGQQLGTDQLLLSEFYSETGGKSFLHITPNEFIKFMVPHLDKVIEADLDKTNKIGSLEVPLSQMKFGNGPGEINHYWEIRLNRLPTDEDLFAVEDIFKSLGARNIPAILMYDEIAQKHSIIVNGTDADFPEVAIKEYHSAIHNYFGSELISLYYSPIAEDEFDFTRI